MKPSHRKGVNVSNLIATAGSGRLSWSLGQIRAKCRDLSVTSAGLAEVHTQKAEGTPYVLVAGQIALDTPAMLDALKHPEGPELVRAVIIHELGHVLGLAHVDDPSQLMHGDANNVTRLADGDRAGLALLGTGACVPQL